MAAKVNSTLEIWISFLEKSIQPVQFISNRCDNSLTIHWTGIKKYVEQRVVGEVS